MLTNHTLEQLLRHCKLSGPDLRRCQIVRSLLVHQWDLRHIAEVVYLEGLAGLDIGTLGIRLCENRYLPLAGIASPWAKWPESSENTISTRRFCWRPAGVSLEATG